MHSPDDSTTPLPVVSPRWSAVAAGLLALEALPALGGAVFFVAELARSQAVVVRNVVMLTALCVVVGVGLLAMARGVLAGRRWPRSPAITWQILLLAVAYYVLTAGFPLSGAAIVVVAVVTIVSVHRATSDA